MPQVVFRPENKRIEVREGENLLRAAMLAGVHVDAPCGGSGTCGKCKLIVEKGEHESDPSEKLSPEELEQGYCLACDTYVESDLEVRVPAEHQPPDRHAAVQADAGALLSTLELEDLVDDLSIDPAVRRVYVELPVPSLEDNISDADRLVKAVSKSLEMENLSLALPLVKRIPSLLRAAEWKVTATVANTGRANEITQIIPGDSAQIFYGLAVDVGTTTVCAELIDLKSGDVVARQSDYNPQSSCGEDVIARIIYASRGEDYLKHLRRLVVGIINDLVEEMIDEADCRSEDIVDIVMAGNTTMTHLLLGVDPRHIREEPYVPVISAAPEVSAAELGLTWADGAKVHLAPGRASYVGGDITAGILGSGLFQSDKLTLYIDVGTNGEIVLGGDKWLLSCSCSAGPAFEGGTIKHGMRAVSGAIEQVRISPDTFEPMILTIGRAKPQGICGSGLIDTMAEMFRAGVIDEKARLNADLDIPRLRQNGSKEYVLVWAEDAGIDRDIVMTEGDLDNLLRAKAAVFAGIITLLNAVDMSVGDIDEMLIAGGFGRYLELNEAVTIGLLPEFPADKVKFVGNGSLLGCKSMLLSRAMRRTASRIARDMTYVELSRDSSFMDRYVSALFLPHTNLEFFPSTSQGKASPRDEGEPRNSEEVRHS